MAIEENPYLAARREWVEVYGSFIKRAEMWRMAAFLSLFVAAVAVIGVVYLASQSHVQPFVVEVDKLGAAVAVKPADAARLSDERIVRYEVSEFVTDARRVSADQLVQKYWLDKIYAMSNSDVREYLNNYYKKNDPLEAGKTFVTEVEIHSALPLSANSWQVDWTETKRNLSGDTLDVTHWEAIVKVSLFVPKTEAEIIKNPAGVIISGLSWTPKL